MTCHHRQGNGIFAHMVEKKGKELEIARKEAKLVQLRMSKLKEVVHSGPVTSDNLITIRTLKGNGSERLYWKTASDDVDKLKLARPETYEIGLSLADKALKLDSLLGGSEKTELFLAAVTYTEQAIKNKLRGKIRTQDFPGEVGKLAITGLKGHPSFYRYEEVVWDAVSEYIIARADFEEKAPDWLS